MRKFLTHILLIVGTALMIQLAFKFVSWHYIRAHTSFKATEDVTTAVFGTSLGETSINDSILSTYKNYCHSATGFVYHRRTLEQVLAQNPSIDTVIIAYGVRTFASSNDGERKYVATARAFHPWNAQLHLADLTSFSWRDIAAILLTDDPKTAFETTPYGFAANPLTYTPDAKWCANWYDDQLKQHANSRLYPYTPDKKRHDYCKDMITYCLERGKQVVIINTPTFNIKRWIDDSGYKHYLSTLPKQVLIADYSDFQMPDSTYFADIHHLNSKGAKFFSNHIKAHGLRLTTIHDYTKL